MANNKLLIVRAAIITKQQEVLLLRRATTESNPGKIELPGGEVEKTDMSPFHAVAREVKEETGYKIPPASFWIHDAERFSPKTKSGLDRSRMLFAVALPEFLPVTLDPDAHDAYYKVPLAEAEGMMTQDIWSDWMGQLAISLARTTDQQVA